MRKMYSKNQLVEIIKQAVEKDEIKTLRIFTISGTLTDSNQDEYQFFMYVLSQFDLTKYSHEELPSLYVIEIDLVGDDDNLYVLNPQMGWDNDVIYAIKESNSIIVEINCDSWEFDSIA